MIINKKLGEYCGGHFVFQFWTLYRKNSARQTAEMNSAYPNKVRTLVKSLLTRFAYTILFLENWHLTTIENTVFATSIYIPLNFITILLISIADKANIHRTTCAHQNQTISQCSMLRTPLNKTESVFHKHYWPSLIRFRCLVIIS